MEFNLANKVMIDIESAGTEPGCPILSIGAYTLDLKHSFYVRISYEDSLAHEFKPSQETLDWWLEQPESVREEAFSGSDKVSLALYMLSAWVGSLGEVEEFWCKGTDFDFKILGYAYKYFGLTPPWKYNQTRDYRTLRKVVPSIEAQHNSNPHNALADARNQAEHCARILERIYTWQL